MYDDVIDETGYSKQAIKDIKWVTEKVNSSLRKDDLSFSHHVEVASLTPEKQTEFLNKAVEEKLYLNVVSNLFS